MQFLFISQLEGKKQLLGNETQWGRGGFSVPNVQQEMKMLSCFFLASLPGATMGEKWTLLFPNIFAKNWATEAKSLCLV